MLIIVWVLCVLMAVCGAVLVGVMCAHFDRDRKFNEAWDEYMEDLEKWRNSDGSGEIPDFRNYKEKYGLR